MYMPICYITIQSQTYVISTCTFIHSHARLESLLCNAIGATFLAHTHILLWVGGVCIDLPVSCPPHSRADTHTYGGGSLHMCSFHSLGSTSHRLRRILCRVDDMESSSCMLSRNPSSRWSFPRKMANIKKMFARESRANGSTAAVSYPNWRTPSVHHKKGRPSAETSHESRPGKPSFCIFRLPHQGSPQTAVGQITRKYRAWQALGILS